MIKDHDIIVLGAGLAGMRAALEAARAGAVVAIVTKVHPLRSHSSAAQGGINAAISETDSWESHAFDTVKGSDYLADQDAVEVMTQEAPSDIIEFEHMGVIFYRGPDGRLGTRAFGGASQARTYFVGDITGQACSLRSTIRFSKPASKSTKSDSQPRSTWKTAPAAAWSRSR